MIKRLADVLFWFFVGSSMLFSVVCIFSGEPELFGASLIMFIPMYALGWSIRYVLTGEKKNIIMPIIKKIVSALYEPPEQKA